MKLGLFCIGMIVSCVWSFAQQPIPTNKIFVGVAAEGGIGTQGVYASQKQILGPRFVGNLGGWLQGSFTFWDRVGLEVGLGQNYMFQRLTDKQFLNNHNNKFDAEVTSQNYFPSSELGLVFLFPFPGNVNKWYVKGAYRMNFLGTGSTSKSAFFAPDGSAIATSNTYNSTNSMVLGEVGVRLPFVGSTEFVAGLKYSVGLDNFSSMQYSVNSQSLAPYSDTYATNGSFIGLVLGVNFHVFSWKFPEIKAAPPKKSQDPPAVAKKVEYIKKIKVSEKTIKIQIFDPNKEDGDVISVAFNKKWLLQNHSVTRNPYQRELELEQGRNTILFQAENLGSIPPNTAVLYVITPQRTYKVSFKTTLDKSQAIEIFY